MIVQRHRYPLILIVSCLLSLQLVCLAQDGGDKKPDKKGKEPDKITKVTVLDRDGRKITRLEIVLQKAPNNMEPEAEPRQIRIDDRANVQFLLKNLSPLDVCSRTSGTPTATQETPVAESLVSTLATIIGGAAPAGAPAAQPSGPMDFALEINSGKIENLVTPPARPPTETKCKVKDDPEYKKINEVWREFQEKAGKFIGSQENERDANGKCKTLDDQAGLACEIDFAALEVANVAGADYRGQTEFEVEKNPSLAKVRKALRPLPTIEDAGNLQAMADEIGAWDKDLHKKYDYSVPPPDAGSPSPPPPVPGVLMVAPASLSFTPANLGLKQVVQLSSGGQPGPFTATPASDGGWLQLSKVDGSKPSTAPLKDISPSRGTFSLVVTVNKALLGKEANYGSITISGTGSAKGTSIVSVVYKPDADTGPTQCDLDSLRSADDLVDRANGVMSLITDNNKTLEGAQATLKSAYTTLVKAAADFQRRKKQGIVYVKNDVLVQEFNLGTDRKDTSPGYFSCVSDVDGKTPTTTNINYSLLYQDIPHWSASTGVLLSFQQKEVIGILNENTPGASTPTNMSIFGVTDHARVQLIPMVFANWGLPFHISQYGKDKESEGVWTAHLSGGFGINPNTGTNQPEFFTGFAVGFNHFLFHSGVHWGRTEHLGGGYTLGSQVPTNSTLLTTAPLSWGYHPAFTIGFSVRVAPY
jgi:hypothetical protein